jgi:hypothetical protein
MEVLMQFFDAILSAGAILTGFCGTFLSFRIQREANYYRQPAPNAQGGQPGDVCYNLQQFSAAFLVLIAATLFCMYFGVAVPLLFFGGWGVLYERKTIVIGLLAGLVLVLAYFVIELVHYEIIRLKVRPSTIEWIFGSLVIVAAIIAVSIS